MSSPEVGKIVWRCQLRYRRENVEARACGWGYIVECQGDCWVSGESGVSGEIEVLEPGYRVGFTACGTLLPCAPGVSGMRGAPKGTCPFPPSPGTPGRGGPALDGGGGGGAAHDGSGQQPAPAGEWGAGSAGASGRWAGTLQLRPLSLLVQVWELRERLGRVRGFWAGLPVTVCGDPRMAADITQEAAPCWTGTGRGR